MRPFGLISRVRKVGLKNRRPLLIVEAHKRGLYGIVNDQPVSAVLCMNVVVSPSSKFVHNVP